MEWNRELSRESLSEVRVEPMVEEYLATTKDIITLFDSLQNGLSAAVA